MNSDMNNNIDDTGYPNRRASDRSDSGIVTKLLIGAAFVAAIGGWWYQSSQVASVRQELAQTQQRMDQVQSQMQASVSVAKSEVNETIARMNEQVEKARTEALAGSRSAQTAAKRQAGEVLNTLSAKNQELTQQLGQIKEDYTQKSVQVDETLNGIKGEVGNVKTDVSATRTELSATTADLKRALGDMGTMSGLIATNSSELAELRKLGERDYFEFTLAKTSAAQRVGDIQLALKKIDTKRNRFTLDVLADDRRVEKKDRTINEPVQFYTSGARAPYELVVNQIGKNQVVGYLSVPKVKAVAKR